MNNFLSKGFTLMEILIVLGILMLIFLVAFPKFAEIRNNQVLKSGVEDIITSINKAKSQTLASLNSLEYGVHFSQNSVTIFPGDTYIAGSSANEVIDIFLPANISSISLVGGVSTLHFSRLTGMPSTSGTITISNSTTSKTITISAAGAVGVN